MKLPKWLTRNKVKTIVINKPKEFKFSTSEAHCIGEYYEYNVTADSREEAFKILVEYFFGECNPEINAKVKSKSAQISYPHLSRIRYDGMPKWFAKRIGGYAREHGENYQHKLEEYAIKHHIKLNNRN